MKRLIWKPNGKERCIRHLAVRINTSFHQTEETLAKHKDLYPDAKPSVDASGQLSAIFEEYAYNTEWASQKQMNEVILSAMQSAYDFERARAGKEPTACMVWLEAKIKEMRS